MAKPFEIAAGSFSLTDTASSFTVWDFPYSLLSNTLYHRKLQGYLGFRGTLCIKLQVNAERFQCGRYMVCAVPVGGAGFTSKLLDYFNIHAATLVQRTQLPHTEIDLATQTSCELRLPFLQTADFYSIPRMNPGTPDPYDGRAANWMVQIFPYSKLDSVSGSTTCKYTLWAHYEDVELLGQATPVELQSGAKTFSEKEAASVGVGPVQSTAVKVSKAASYLTPVPVIGAFASQLGWVSDIVANVASVFGWSKPNNLEQQHRYKITNAQYATNVDNVDMSLPLSLSVKNSVKTMTLGMTDQDELDFSYLAGIPSWQQTATWNTAQTEDTQIMLLRVSPYCNNSYTSSVYQTTVGGQTFSHLTPAQYLGTKFQLWRGSVIFKFKFVKTEFHSGRLSFDFNPKTAGDAGRLVPDSLAPYVYRDIVDIRSLTEYTVEIPYISDVPYCTTDLSNTSFDNFFGLLDVRVIDPLVAPDSVPSSIKILVEVSMGKDVEYAVVNVKGTNTLPQIELQSGLSTSTVIGGSQPKTYQLETSQLAIGERISSLRTLLKRFEPLYRERVTLENGAVFTTVYPFGAQYVSTSPGIYFGTNNDLYSELAFMFAFSRGGVRFKFAGAVDGERSVVAKYFYCGTSYNVSSIHNTGTTPVPNVWAQDDVFMRNSNYVVETISPSKWIEVSIPQYSRAHSRCNLIYSFGDGAGPSDQLRARPSRVGLTDNMFLQVSEYLPSATSSAAWSSRPPLYLSVFRAGAEDTNFSCFVSIPPMRVFGIGAL
nr:MAG: polyprotein 2 [Picornavirales sp.]